MKGQIDCDLLNYITQEFVSQKIVTAFQTNLKQDKVLSKRPKVVFIVTTEYSAMKFFFPLLPPPKMFLATIRDNKKS